ncbi:MAG: NAD(P)H-hydrate epimerase [Boseongicola sp.]|nr:NAD(P)H-hydrate epimerase [Boseongicola sp.]
MTTPLTSSQMRDIEQAAIASGTVTGLELMDRAGKAVVKAIFETWPDLLNAPRRAGILAGPGNNGGDGFVIANRFRDYGWDVEVFHYGDIDKMPPDAKTNALAFANAGGVVSPLIPHAGRDMRFADPPTDIWIDAVFGIGLTRPLPDEVTAAFKAIATESPASKCVAVDILSGIDADTGAVLTDLPVTPDMTVTFHAPKIGHTTGAGAACTGQLIVKDIGL